ncbi:MAG TPA: FemAB family XrtA/PEP-CTERM system-associated protein [Burkholderiales bacterium]|nr:FemAB family XrtA/PEP-CTERM system-associated protein [Burkholderiales bacterium]
MSQLTFEALPGGRTSTAAATDTVQVRTLQPDDVDRWDKFVSGCGEATFFHRAGWKTVIEREFGHQTHFLYAEAGGRIEGVLPLAEVESLLFGHTLVGLPFCVYGGVAAESERARCALEAAARDLAESRGVDHLEFRNRTPQHPDWERSDLYVTFRKAIDPDLERNMLEIPRKQRAMVRKGIKAGLTGEVDEGVERFFTAYSDSVHRLGTPVFSKRYFRILKEVFGPDCEVLTITQDGQLVASVLSFYFRDEVLPYYGGGVVRAREVAGNDFMYWEVMRRACERGLRTFDYGRSKRGTGSFDFKKNWGFEPQPLHYEYLLVRSKRVPDVNPLNPKYRLLINLWRRLPLPLANLIGPHVVKNLG